MGVEERGREQREAPSPPAEGGVRQQLIDSQFGQNQNNVKLAVAERNSKVNCQSSPLFEARQCVQCSTELTTAVGHLLRASQQGFLQPFVCRLSASIVSFPNIVKLIRAPQQHPQAPNPTANDRDVDCGRLSPSLKQRVAMETGERAGCHGIRQGESVPSFESKQINCPFFHRLKFAKVLRALQCCQCIVGLCCGLKSEELLPFHRQLLADVSDVMARKNSPLLLRHDEGNGCEILSNVLLLSHSTCLRAAAESPSNGGKLLLERRRCSVGSRSRAQATR
jgi:hypothetical protein